MSYVLSELSMNELIKLTSMDDRLERVLTSWFWRMGVFVSMKTPGTLND